MIKRVNRIATANTTRHYFNPRSQGDSSIAPVVDFDQAAGAREITIRACGVALPMLTGAEVFARSGLDAGTLLLLETAALADRHAICDLGCGWGAVGCVVAHTVPEAAVWLCDINWRAVHLARANLKRNGIQNAALWTGNGLHAARDHCFDAILCNPPVRAGNTVIADLFAEAHRCLAPGGSLWVVLRTAQGAKSWQRRLQTDWGNCETRAIEGGYRILESVKRS